MKELDMIVWHDLVPKRRNGKKRSYVAFFNFISQVVFILILFRKANSKVIYHDAIFLVSSFHIFTR